MYDTAAESAAQLKYMRVLYDISRKLTGKGFHQIRPINLLTSADDQIKRWQNHFCEVMKPNTSDNKSNISELPPTGSNTRLHIQPPSIDEIIVAIKSLKKQVKTNTSIPSSFIHFIYMGGTGPCDSSKIIFGNHVYS